jgi:hypothetical protein
VPHLPRALARIVRKPVLSSLIALLAFLWAGCGTLPSGRGWGQDATLTPGWERVRAAAWKNATDPWTWAPLTLAAGLQIDDWDRRISDWARDETPIFGSTKHAEDASDTWRSASGYMWIASIFATQSGDGAGEWAWSKTKGAVVEIAAKGAGRALTSVLKDTVSRERPNGEDNRSFPSGHMTEAYGSAVMTSRNLDSTGFPESVIWPLRVVDYGLALGTGWARVEAGAHFPSDILFATGATNFLAGFVHDAFLGLGSNPQFVVSPAPEGDGIEVGLLWTR